ncbi:aldehyde dehydrogenase family protein, partial [Candidatus Protofrankia californiensis]|uniref:aldehyde dehydrogenase family protein n=1 Tax=Candidatus Protofrankia californiensis TaxID=1839754 RepID=UPI0010416CD3
MTLLPSSTDDTGTDGTAGPAGPTARAAVDGPAGSGEATPEQVADVVARLRKSFAGGRTRSLAWRVDQLRAIERLVTEHETDIAEAIGADLGRAAVDSWLGDVAPVRTEAAYARRHLRSWMRRRRTGLPLVARPGRAWYQYEPLGVVLVIGPWNYPVYLSLGPLVGAVAAGNCAVIKPSEHAPVCSALLARLVPQYLDPDAVAVVEGEAQATQLLLDQGLDHAFFTGGPEIGKIVMASAARHLTPVTLELGGKSPAIVTRHADLEVAARRIAWTKLLNSGQTCIAPDYVLVETEVRDRFVTQLVQTIRSFRSGAPATLPIVNRRQFERLAALLDGAGGTVVLGGSVDADRAAVEPTVVVDPDPDAPVMREEIFGPILPVVGVSSLDEAVVLVNLGPKPLAAYLFSSAKSEREQVLREVSAGGIVINHAAVHCLVPQLPFGGVGNSGMGAYHGRWGFETFSHRKAVLSKPARPDLSLIYPPYSAR